MANSTESATPPAWLRNAALASSVVSLACYLAFSQGMRKSIGYLIDGAEFVAQTLG